MKKTTFILLILNFLLVLSGVEGLINQAQAQTKVDYKNPKEYTLGGVTVEGTEYLDKQILVVLSGLKVGEKVVVPSEQTANAIRKLWKQGLFDDVQLTIDRIEGNNIFLKLFLQERPRLSKFAYSKNLKRGRVDDINDLLKDYKGKIVTENLKSTIENKIKKYYQEKAYWNAVVILEEVKDTIIQNGAVLKIGIQEKNKVRIREIAFEGNQSIKDQKLRRAMKETKQKKGFWGFFRGAKFNESDYKNDKKLVVAKYNDFGFRDAKIPHDTVFQVAEQYFKIEIDIAEGQVYYFRDVDFVGNTIYPDSSLHKILGIEKGDIYNQSLLDSRLFGDASGRDVTTLYMDNGYLFFELVPVEVNVENDSIDLEIRIREGAQATIGEVRVIGNDKTNDHVILRELRTRPGQKFNRSDIIRTTRELAATGYFDPEQIGVTPYPNPVDGTVDIEYKVVERSSDQIELSGGWGAGRVVGSLGLSLNNFSARNMFKKGTWRPIPSGDGQRLSIRAQSNGIFFQSYNASFTEPWLGGKKPNSFSVSLYTSVQSNGVRKNEPNRQSIVIRGVGVSLGKRLKWPDDYFTLVHSANYQRYILNNYQATPFLSNGIANNFYFKETLARTSIDQQIYPRSGSQFNLSLQITPPYSLLNNKDYSQLEPSERYELIEYHKWRFDASWFIKLVGDLVLNPKIQYGFLGNFSNEVGDVPFGRFFVGGDGITGFNIDDRELIGLRGYANNSVTPKNQFGARIGGVAFQKYVLELRYPVTLNPSATIYLLSFLEAGNNYSSLKNFDPFDNLRSAGVGVRVFLPMFGLLGVDWGYGFDDNLVPDSNQRGNIHVSIGQRF